MRKRHVWVLLAPVIMIAAYYIPDAPLALAKRVLEILVIIHLSLEMLNS
jgi:hypothetical protein